ncbi:MAG: Uma2 family endonuclease [Longimicrobiales bacterium]
MASVTEHRFTVEEYERLEGPDDFHSELIRGLVVREPPPGLPHGRCQTLIASRLERFAQDRGLGVVFTEVGVVIDERTPTVLGPDVLFVARDRLPSPLPQGFLRLAPDLVVEIVSPSNSASAVHEKVLLYLDVGTRLVWVIDPRSRTATVYRSRHDIEIVGESEVLEGGQVLPGLELLLGSILPD